MVKMSPMKQKMAGITVYLAKGGAKKVKIQNTNAKSVLKMPTIIQKIPTGA